MAVLDAEVIMATDRGYADYGWFAGLTEEGAYLGTAGSNADYLLVETA